MSPLLEVVDLSASYGGNEALHSVNFEVKQGGQCVVVLGPNGAGKSTLLRSIMGLTSCVGRVNFADRAIQGLATRHRAAAGLMLVPETRGVFGPLTVAENLDLGTYVRTRESASTLNQDREMVFDLFPRLKERLKQVAGTLSGGEQQMLAIGRALMSKPKLLLLDEPSLGLAPRLAEEIFLALEVLRDGGLALAIVEQRAPLALDLADRVYVLQTGKISRPLLPGELGDAESLLQVYFGADS